MSNIAIKRLLTAQEFNQAVELQKVYWGTDASNLVPRHMLHSLCHHGGHLLGAYDGSRLVGFVMGFLGTALDAEAPDADHTASNLLIMSKRMLVLPGYRGRNIGLKLKMAQRDIALKQGIDLVTWTFDPLLAANAHLNLRKLGAISRQFAVNYFDYSEAESLSADRLIVQWRVKGERARACASGSTSRRTLKQCLDESIPIVNVIEESGPAMAPRALSQLSDRDSLLVEIPSDVRHLDKHMPEVARRWRSHIRELMGRLIESGYVVYDFVSAVQEQRRRTYYFLSRREYRV
ncbi:MAG: GNAT family N-acetyltransferase [Chloroflexi bacterium]|nr:GNAT family N-acetyltransferase [Chloroflexota bacterium]